MRKIIFVDIDGTIVDNVNGLDHVSLKTKYAFKELSKQHYVFIASGRSKCMLPEEIIDLKPNGFLLANGAYAEVDGQAIINISFTDEEIEQVKDFVKDEHYVAYLESQNWMYTISMDRPLHKRFKENWVTPDVYVEYDDPKEKINVIMMAAENEAYAAKLEKTFDQGMKARRHQGFTSYDIDLPNVSKGSAVVEILKILDIPFEDSYAFGDGLNDLEMMKSVNHSIAMGNAFPELKSICKEVTKSAIEDGFYYGCLKHGLIEEMDE